MIRRLEKVITFDTEGVLDTVECGGILLSAKNAVVKIILNNADRIRSGFILSSFNKVNL